MTKGTQNVWLLACFGGNFNFLVWHRHLFLTWVIPPYYYKVPHTGSDTNHFIVLHFLIILSLNTLIFLIYFPLEDIFLPADPFSMAHIEFYCYKLHLNCWLLFRHFKDTCLDTSTYDCIPSPFAAFNLFYSEK